MIPNSTRDQIIGALQDFDRTLRDSQEWRDWERRGNHKYAIVFNGTRYPVKQIIHMATGGSKSEFTGGRESNTYLAERGFEVTELNRNGKPSLQSSFEAILTSYRETQRGPYRRDPVLWGHFESIQDRLKELSAIRNRDRLKVSWSAGRGNWAQVPWIVLLDERESTSSQKGIYCVFLFRADTSGVYLTFNQGVIEPKSRLGPAAGLTEVRETAAQLRRIASPLLRRGFFVDDKIDLHADPGLGRDYESSTIAYKLYERGNVPDDEDIADDVEALLDVYEVYLSGGAMENVTRAGLDAMRGRFLNHLPEFIDFPSASADSKYARDEKNYKAELVRLFQQTLAPRLQAPPESDEIEELLCDAVLQFLRHKLESTGRPQNLLLWRDFDFLNKLNAVDKRQFASMLRALLYGDRSAEDRIEAFNKEATKLFEGAGIKFSHSWTRIFPTYFLMIAHPDTEILVKTTEFNKTAQEVMGWGPLESKSFDAEQYRRMKQLTAIVRDALEHWGWGPQDMLDVQSFIWVAQAKGSLSSAREDANDPTAEDSALEAIPYEAPHFDEIRAHVLETEGIRLPAGLLRRYHIALQTRGFVILSGISGSGKTWLTEAYANAVSARYLLAPVAPNWTTNEDLLGFYNPLDGVYHDTAFSRFLREAGAAYEAAYKQGVEPQPFHLVLDEMNLARVEYYFAKFLSAMELRSRKGTAPIELGPNSVVPLTPNLRFIGTVNVDETTHDFADKVYDRAQLIELDAPRALLVEHLGGAAFAGPLLEICDCVGELAPFGFRILDNITDYVARAESLGISWSVALDEQILQKILPKIKGADLRVGDVLQQLKIVSQDRFPLTHLKASVMLERFQKHGFTTYF